MENARLLILELIFNVHRSINLSLLASTLSMSEKECEEWIKELINQQTVELVMNEKCVAVNHTNPSLYDICIGLRCRYGQVMEGKGTVGW